MLSRSSLEAKLCERDSKPLEAQDHQIIVESVAEFALPRAIRQAHVPQIMVERKAVRARLKATGNSGSRVSATDGHWQAHDLQITVESVAEFAPLKAIQQAHVPQIMVEGKAVRARLKATGNSRSPDHG